LLNLVLDICAAIYICQVRGIKTEQCCSYAQHIGAVIEISGFIEVNKRFFQNGFAFCQFATIGFYGNFAHKFGMTGIQFRHLFF
jgi:hypothetical protein